MDTARRQVVVFLVLTFAACVPFYYLIIAAGGLEGPGGRYVIGIMWCPGLAALATRLIFQRDLRGFGWGWGGTRYQVWSYLLPALAGLVVYGLVWATGLGGFDAEGWTGRMAETLGKDSLGLPAALAVVATLGFLESALFAAGEELGWRGLLVPELAKLTGYTRVSLGSAAVWAVYHYPLLLFADYHSAAPRGYALVFFTVTITAGCFVYAWFRLRSGSVWTAVVLHASHNLFVQGVFDRLTVDRGPTPYLTTEFGAGLAVAYSLVAWWCWRRRDRLPPAPPARGAVASTRPSSV
jgi:membrane protease YdiL (CAAX protease family)